MHSELEIHFVGISHPFAKFPQNERAVLEVERLKKAYPQNIFSHAWMKSEDYLELLTDLDAVVLLSKYEVEEQYSIRTRLFEILESKIPVILNSKDHLSNLIQEFQLGHQISHLDSVKFPELIQQVLHSNHSRNWEAFFTEFNKNRLKSNLLESIATLKKKNKVNLKNPYLQIRLHSFHKLLWKVQKLKKLTYSELCNKVISKLKRRFK
ncbi:hypothetical protein MJH12_09895 [bacterium]|nr:hypothetical protein [bacterium]